MIHFANYPLSKTCSFDACLIWKPLPFVIFDGMAELSLLFLGINPPHVVYVLVLLVRALQMNS